MDIIFWKNRTQKYTCMQLNWASPSLDIPSARHFCRRQCWQRLRFVLSMRQFLWRGQEYEALFCWLRLKKPWLHVNRKIQALDVTGAKTLLELSAEFLKKSYLTALTCNDSIMDAWWFVSADFAWYNFDLGCKKKKEEKIFKKCILNSIKTFAPQLHCTPYSVRDAEPQLRL